jgi:putative FmdB family regulatory protein
LPWRISVPTYQYVCTDCGEDLEVVQKFSDASLTTHDACGGKLRKIYSPVGIVFKGSGFYRTDSRGSSSVTGSTTGSSDDKPAAKSEKSDKSESKSEKTTSDSSTTATSTKSESKSSSATKVA